MWFYAVVAIVFAGALYVDWRMNMRDAVAAARGAAYGSLPDGKLHFAYHEYMGADGQVITRHYSGIRKRAVVAQVKTRADYENVYQHIHPVLLAALHYFMGIGGTDEFVKGFPVEQWHEANELVTIRLRTYCKCDHAGTCLVCESISKVPSTSVPQEQKQ